MNHALVAAAIDENLSISKMVAYIKEIFRDDVALTNVEIDVAFSKSGCKLSYKDLHEHCMTLRLEHIQRIIRPILSKLIMHPRNLEIFNYPVDPVALNLPDYNRRIQQPMDLGTIRTNINVGSVYDSIEGVVSDIALVFQNAMSYNSPSSFVHDAAMQLCTDFGADLLEAQRKTEPSKHYCVSCLGSVCILCGGRCLTFETPVLICNGPCCQRLKKSSVYYISMDGSMLWCQVSLEDL